MRLTQIDVAVTIRGSAELAEVCRRALQRILPAIELRRPVKGPDGWHVLYGTLRMGPRGGFQ